MIRCLFCVLFTLFSFSGIAQEIIRGFVVNSTDEAIDGATVIMLSGKDSTYLQGTVSGKDGSFSLSCQQKNVMIVVSYLGYQTAKVMLGDNTTNKIVLKEDTKQLHEVSIKASRPVSRLTRDGFIYTIKGTLLENSGSLTEILDQMPLVKKSSDGYEVMGKGQAVFFLNGHRVYNMSELDNIAAKNVKDVQIVTTPGSQYDSSIKAIIHITTTANTTEGLGGDARSTWYQAHQSSWIQQLNLHFTKSSWEVYDNIKFQIDNDRTWKDLTQTVFADTLWNEISKEQECRKQTVLENTAGVDWKISTNSYIGGRYMLSVDLKNNMEMTSLNDVTAGSTRYDYLETHGTEKGHKYPQHQLNLYYSGTAHGFKMNADIDYITGIVKLDNVFRETSETSSDRTIESDSRVKNKMFSLRTTVEHKLFGGDGTLGLEYKKINRNDDYSSQQEWIPTSFSLLKEKQIAPFIDYSKLTKIGLFGLGMRLENSRFDYYSEGQHVPEQSQETTKLFPNFSWGIRVGALQAQLAYSTSSQRPTFRQLSYNTLYGSRYVWQRGNPLLRPEYIHELSIQGLWKFLQFQASYSDTRNAIINWASQQVFHPVVSVMSYRNLPSVKQIRLAVVLSKTMGIWNPQLTLALNKQFLHLDTEMGTYSLNSPIFVTKLSNNFKVSPSLSIFLTGNYQSTGDYRNVHLNRHVWYINFNMQKTFFKDTFSIQFKVNDIFNTNKDGNEIYNEKMIMNLTNRYESRNVSLTLRYMFNNKEHKQHSNSKIEEELRRL